MATRLEVTYGLIAEPDRRSTSADTLGVSHPSTGSQVRSKGVLGVIVSASTPGVSARPATQLVADTIRNEYYYDESAGVPVCLEKAIRNADRRLRASREGAGLAPGALGVGVAVVRNNELYLATIGGVEAYLVRNARLLMPDRRAVPGLPGGAEDAAGVDVWRGELSVGDALLLVSRNMTETVGTEELKSAMLTLHPQAAVEHLHHLFVAAGGEGSDAMIAVEATERSTHAPARTRPASGASFGDLPRMPAPVGTAGGSAVALGRNPIGQWMTRMVDRAWELAPSRRPSIRGISPRISQAETQRRAAFGVLAFVGIILALGVIVVLLPRGGERSPSQVAAGDSALSVAADRAQRAANIAVTDPPEAMRLYREAYDEISSARASGVRANALDQLDTQVRRGLDALYGARSVTAEPLVTFDGGTDPVALTRGPIGDDAAYYIDATNSSVHRVDLGSGNDAEVVTRGDKAVSGNSRIGEPEQIEAGGSEVVIVDDEARAWRWRPSDETGRGTLARLSFIGDAKWGADHGDVETYSDSNGYRIYVVEPSLGQIIRYQPTLDQSAFGPPGDYLITQSDEVSLFRQLHIDGDVWALDDEGVQKYTTGRFEGGFMLAEPPDASDVRPGHDYQLISGTGTDSSGRLYLYDSVWDRLIVFDKASGDYVGQWITGPGGPSMKEMRGFLVIPKSKQKPETLVWLTPEGLYRAQLTTPTDRDPNATERPTKRDRKNRGNRDAG
jgi:hypothetical protein